ncbi:hypothetical protein UB44_05420 [Burkholderiaceae bacterium 26]|nr:hypothetical protein UB44_05420 [Burkholderiaceae bacterium 26]
MKEIIELQLSFRLDAYPFSARALRNFGSARSRSDYLKTVIETHFRALEGYLPMQQEHVPSPAAQQLEGGRDSKPVACLDAADVARTFSSFFE